MSHNRLGYSLVEVLVSLAIVGLLFTFGFASFRDFSRRQHLISVARSIKGELRLIQAKAISGEKPEEVECTGVNTLITFNFQIVNPSTYQVVAVCSGGSVTTKTETISDDTTMASSQNPISFKVLGQGTNVSAGAGAIITFTQVGTNSTATVTVTEGGEVK